MFPLEGTHYTPGLLPMRIISILLVLALLSALLIVITIWGSREDLRAQFLDPCRTDQDCTAEFVCREGRCQRT